MSLLSRCLLACWLLSFAGMVNAQLSVVPADPTPLDLVSLHFAHTGCTNPDSVQVSMQVNRITVSANRLFSNPDYGTVLGYFDEYTMGRLPAGDYDVELIVNPPPGTLGPSMLIGPIHFTVAQLPPTGSLLPHEDYSDVWWNPQAPGQALTVKQSGAKLAAAWYVHDGSGNPIWYTLQSGSWVRDSVNGLHYEGVVYKTTGPYWAGRYDPAAVATIVAGKASFIPQSGGQGARFDYEIEGVSGSQQLKRLAF